MPTLTGKSISHDDGILTSTNPQSDVWTQDVKHMTYTLRLYCVSGVYHLVLIEQNTREGYTFYTHISSAYTEIAY